MFATAADSRIDRAAWLIFLGAALFLLGPALAFEFGGTYPPRPHLPANRLLLRSVGDQLELFRQHCGRYPTVEEGLTALAVRPDNADVASSWLGPYSKGTATDSWGRELAYQIDGTGTSVRIWSFGPDGVDGTNDDIAVSKP